MSHAIIFDDRPMTIDAFDAYVDSLPDGRLWELVAGRAVCMTNPTVAHGQIVSNVGLRLKLAADRRGYQAFFGGMRVQRSDGRAAADKPRPDILVRCGVLPRTNYVTDPLIVVEVLSPSTIDFDRGETLRFYQGLPTLPHIVLIYQDQMRVEHYHRAYPDWTVEALTFGEDAMAFEPLGAVVALADVYFGVQPGAAPRDPS